MSMLVEDDDYYFNEEGNMVFTQTYHLKRGFCCGNGCKHCPYQYKNVAEPNKSELLLKLAKLSETNPILPGNESKDG